MARAGQLIGLCVAAACANTDGARSTAGPEPSPPPPAPLAPTGPQLQDLHPEGAIGPRCLLQPVLEAKETEDGIELRVALLNRDGSEHQVELRVDCPGGPVRFSGLAPSYDYYQTCNMGPCIAPDPPRRLTLAAGSAAPLTQIVLHRRGNSCQPNLQIGPDPLVARVEFLNATTPEVCEVGALMLPGAPPAPAPPPLTPPAPPSPPTPSVPQPGPCPKPVACGLACPGAYAVDQRGCSLCACADHDLTR